MNAFPGFDRMFELRDTLATRPYRGNFDHWDSGFEITRGETRVLEPIDVLWHMGGGTPGDLVWTGPTAPLIASARVVELLEADRVTGWQSFPVRVFNKLDEECGDYFGLSVSGRVGTVDLSKSKIVLEKMPGGYRPFFQGHYFEPASWDGSDFAVCVRDRQGRASSQIIVSERVVNLFMKNRIKNLRSESLANVTVRTSIYEISLPHLLPADFRDRITAAYSLAGIDPPERYRWTS